jgi:hypothetical protein
MAKSALEMIMPGFLKSLGLDPDTVTQTIENVGKVVIEIRDRLARIEAKLDRSLPLEPDPADFTTEVDNGEQTGSGAP